MELSNRSGFTLVEVIVATIILTVGVLGIVNATGQVTRIQGRAVRTPCAPLAVPAPVLYFGTKFSLIHGTESRTEE